MKNFVKEGQKLPLYGVGPHIVCGMVAVTAACIVLFNYILGIGCLAGSWSLVFRIVGCVLVVLGFAVWFVGAVCSGMDESIANNKLKTKDIYAWVRNPMYSGWWILVAGISLMWANAWVLIAVPVNWLIMTVALRCTEEAWLLELYGDEYASYKRRVNRCIPWFPRREG